MINLNLQIIFICLLATLIACKDSVQSSGDGASSKPPVNNSETWIIPKEEVLDGGPGQDGIPAIDKPNFAPANTIDFISDDRLVVGIKIGDTVKAYPHEILDYHEIVNDQIDEELFSLTYCPLTGTAIAWERGSVKSFGVSGLIFRNNLIPYDRNTGSRYSQMQMRGVNGALAGIRLATIPVIQTNWTTWREIFPESQVLTTDTSFNRSYDKDLYGKGYREEDSATLFPVKNKDNRLPRKKLVHGIVWGTQATEDARVKVYVIDQFGKGVNLIKDNFAGGEITVVGSTDKHFAVSYFNRQNDGIKLQFEAVEDALPVILRDQEGTRWDIFGYAVEGPRKGDRLRTTNSYSGYWFAWADFFPTLSIYQQHVR
ncbi:DUF3179 domain-containing protein [Aliifodinibius sp. S!AR15-10]|uniref:DUF3179 domain-containing protein n=1 Tax=Aliifodinibius sp. S!AR15-10 TaxID=2950437 RepID=UPI0028656A95|nr:DUF3179 domain-containing protein [Aliifodinibius sp. S!AR15-10]MDR8394275.1 DUF3179 domain-containing protein [Aliifodinibius sp. S!AR15-10]